MAWNFKDQGSKGTGIARDFSLEGNVPVYIFREEQDRVRFLIEPFDVKVIAKKLKLSQDEAEEHIYTKMLWQEWVMPVGVWEHTIPAVPQKRFFSTHVCPGMQICPMCAKNNEAKESGVTENKLLPYPVRKRFIAPIWSYRLKRVVYLKQNQDFYEEINAYIDKNGLDIDFDIWRVGKGFNTKYKSVFLGKSEQTIDELAPELILPGDMIWNDADEIDRKMSGRQRNDSSIISEDPGDSISKTTIEESSENEEEKSETVSENSSHGVPLSGKTKTTKTKNEISSGKEIIGDVAFDLGSFVIPFGSHKGKNLHEIFDNGDLAYLEFLETRSSGSVQEAVSAFLKEQVG